MDPASSDANEARGERVFIGMGSNLGDRTARLDAAVAALRALEGVAVRAVSPLYETDPVGPPPQGPYLNAAVGLECRLSPVELLSALLVIEADRGRIRGLERNVARTLDLDILLFGGRVIDEPGLVVPHPRLCERPFVLEPLAAIAAKDTHPTRGETMEALAARVRDPRAVRLFNSK